MAIEILHLTLAIGTLFYLTLPGYYSCKQALTWQSPLSLILLTTLENSWEKRGDDMLYLEKPKKNVYKITRLWYIYLYIYININIHIYTYMYTFIYK